MAASQVVQAPCKVNLHLGIHHGRDARGYHRVDSLMVPVALLDTIVVEDADALEVAHEPALGVGPCRTTVWRAAQMLADELGVRPDVRVSVRARIPERAGLGGSSADAGATLRALAERWGVGPHDPRVVSVARRVGADVAFFLGPVPSLCLGAGDVVERTFLPFEVPLALVMPDGVGVSTVEAYEEFDRSGADPAPFDDACAAAEEGSPRAVGSCLFNNLADAACALCPEVARVVGWLRGRDGVVGAQVSGSGACSFAVCETPQAARDVARDARAMGWRSWVTNSIGADAKVW